MIDTMLPDGNCLFLALSKALFGLQSGHLIIRKQLVVMIKCNPHMFSGLCNYPFELHCTKMVTAGNLVHKLSCKRLNLIFRDKSLSTTRLLENKPGNGCCTNHTLLPSHGNIYFPCTSLTSSFYFLPFLYPPQSFGNPYNLTLPPCTFFIFLIFSHPDHKQSPHCISLVKKLISFLQNLNALPFKHTNIRFSFPMQYAHISLIHTLP